MYIFSYTARATSIEGNTRDEYGFIAAESFTDAMSKVEEYFGDEAEAIFLDILDSGELVQISDKYLFEKVSDDIKEHAIF